MIRSITRVLVILVAALVLSAASKDKLAASEDQAAPEGMVLIRGGDFWMGCSPGDKACDTDESPRHQVKLKPFYMDIYETTQAGYEKVMGTNPSKFDKCTDCPVERVTWTEAQAFCAKTGKRLPTEAEFEFAARGGSGSVRSGSIEALAWFAGDSLNEIHPVGSKKPNSLGLYDILGNVQEWCSDWYDKKYYETSPAADPKGPDAGTARVLRGGAFSFDGASVRASAREWYAPDGRMMYSGFRCAMDADGVKSTPSRDKPTGETQ